MCTQEVMTVFKIAGLFFFLEAILFVFLFVSFFHSYEMHLKVLSSGFVSLFFTTLIWIAILLAIRKEEHSLECGQPEDEDVQELIQV